MKNSFINKNITREKIEEAARQSARYFIVRFEQDDLDVTEITNMLAILCSEHKELAIHLGLLRYCQLYKHNLPERYIEIAADNEAYDNYCKKLTTHLIDMNTI